LFGIAHGLNWDGPEIDPGAAETTVAATDVWI